MGFFPRFFSGASFSITSYAQACFYAVSLFLCCVNLWTLPVYVYFTPCAFLEEKMPLQYLYDFQTVQKGDKAWGPGRHLRDGFYLLLLSARPHRYVVEAV